MYVLHCRVVDLTVLELARVRTLFTDPASSAVWRCCACCVTCAGEAKCEALSAKSVAPLHAGGFWCVAGHTRSVVVSRVYHASALTPSDAPPCVCVCVVATYQAATYSSARTTPAHRGLRRRMAHLLTRC